MNVRFAPLPPRRSSQKPHAAAQALRDRPGEWAHIHTHSSGTRDENSNRANNQSHRIRTSTLVAFRPAGAFEATTRSNEDGTTEVWARYVAKDDAPSHTP
ncbi:hypothetical protein [Streptomyces sp. NPDC090026]|uniref:hypothetical protein n=1 Tax=Streptomyces sp. NPDC090026 TaxID=3365923 RepID=UPI00381D0E63